MKNKGFFVVHEWMATELGLKSTDLLIYAIIYGFTQIEEQSFFGTRRYLAEFIGSSIPTVQRSLDTLVARGLIQRNVSEIPANGMRIVSYKVNLNLPYQNDTGIKMIHNDNIHKSISNTDSNSSNTTRFKKPTVDEVREYCLKHNYTIDPEAFIDYNESKGWVVGKSPMKDWRAAVRTWVRNKKQRDSSPTKKLPKVDWGDDG